MMSASGGATEEVVSLSVRQVNSLLRALELHREMLQVGHEDARRFNLDNRRPGYLLDFDLIYQYAFEGEDQPELVSELRFLLEGSDARFLIGPGTQLEIEKFLYSAGFVIGADLYAEDGPTLEGPPRHIPRPARTHLDPAAIQGGMMRLSNLLRSSNVVR